jgi:hypothetical protein
MKATPNSQKVLNQLKKNPNPKKKVRESKNSTPVKINATS